MRDERSPSQAAENHPALMMRVPEAVAEGAEPDLLGAPDNLDRLLGLLKAAARGQAYATRPAGSRHRSGAGRFGCRRAGHGSSPEQPGQLRPLVPRRGDQVAHRVGVHPLSGERLQARQDRPRVGDGRVQLLRAE